MSDKKIAILAVFFGALLAGGAAAITKKGISEIPPFSFVFLRFVVASLCVLPFFLHKPYFKFSQMRGLAPISLFATANVIFFVLGVKLTTANFGSVIYAAGPLLVSVILYLLFNSKLGNKKVLGIIVGFIGVLIITILPLLEKNNPFAGNLLGNFFLMIAIISQSFYFVYSEKIQIKHSPLAITVNFIFVTTLVFAPLFIWDLINKFGWWQNVTAWGIFSVLYMAIAVTVLVYILHQYAIKHGGSVMAATMFYILPIFGFIINFILLGEMLTLGFIFGSALALLGTYLVVRK